MKSSTATSSTRQRVGLVLTGLFCAGNIPSALFSTPSGQAGPPLSILVVDTLLGVGGLVAAIIAWRTGSRVALRAAAGALIVITLTGLPAFFVGVPAGIKLMVAVTTLLAILAVVLLFSPARRPVSVLD